MLRFNCAGNLGWCLLLTMAWVLAPGQGRAMAQDQKAGAKAESKTSATEDGKLTGRLPAYYATVVTRDQKQQIYKIQQEYAPRVKELQTQIDNLNKQRDEKIEALLTAEQKQKVEALKTEAAAKRKQGKPAEDGKRAEKK